MPASEGGRVEDHVHLLCHFGRTITQAEWVKTGLKPTKMPAQLKHDCAISLPREEAAAGQSQQGDQGPGDFHARDGSNPFDANRQNRKGVLKLDPARGTEDPIAGPLEYRAALLESFYDKSKTWYSRTAPSVNSED